MSRIVVTSLSEESSSRLPYYLGKAIEPGNQVHHEAPHVSRLGRLAWMALTFRPNRRLWRDAFERQTQHRLRTWQDFSSQLQARPGVRESDAILQEGLHFNSFPEGYRGKCALYLHGTLSMVLKTDLFDCDMWRPPDHEIEPWLAEEKQVLRRADRIFVGASFLARVLEHEYGVPRDKIIVAGTGQPPLPTDHSYSGTYAASGKLLFVGKAFERKGGEVVVKAFHKVLEQMPSARLQIVGPHKINVPRHPSIDFFGPINDRKRVDQLYREAAAFVMPSLHESFGFVFLEAMSRGLPCIGTNIFAMPEIIQHQRTGLIVEPGKVDELAEAMLWILRHPQEAAKMGEAGREYARTSFTWRTVGENILRGLGLGEAQRAVHAGPPMAAVS